MSISLSIDIAINWIPVQEPLFKFATLWLSLYLVHVLLYLSSGAILTQINRRNPRRRIQDRPSRVPASVEIRQGFVSLLGSSLCLSAGLWAQYAGWSPAPVELLIGDSYTTLASLGWLVLFLLASILLADIWFYAEHRLVHVRWLFPVHREHHLSPTPTPWTNDRFSFVEVILIQSYLWVVPFVLPIPGLVLIIHRLYDQVKGMIGHGGHEYFAGRGARWPLPFTCVTHHDRHHQAFNCNYGSFLTIWDRMFGTLEANYDDKIRRLAEKY